MCGILGGNNPRWNYIKGIECMKHRGPDGTKVTKLEDFCLAFTRLAVIDLSENGMQPMFSKDNQVAIVYNGEIYGYQKLRRQLEKRGYQFSSNSDTEVILNAYLEYGERFVAKIDGMFAIAIYDKREGRSGTVRLYRDRLGIKPLYYYYDGRNFGFSSELKGIINMCSDISLQIDNTAIYDYLNYIYIPEPKTMYKNAYKLLPAYRLEFDVYSQKIIKNGAYWKLNINGTRGVQRKQEDLICEVRELIRQSVKEQMAADVPVGVFLSGGVDSSIITYESSQINPQIESFSIGFKEAPYNELNFARQLAVRYQIRRNEKIFDRDVFHENFESLKQWYDEPFADTSAFPTYLVSREARDKVIVVLTGDGSDEVFGGYSRYGILEEKEQKKGYDNILISKLYCRFRKDRKYDWKYLDDLNLYNSNMAPTLTANDKVLRERLRIPRDYDKLWYFRKYYRKDLPAVTRMQYMDLKTYLPSDILTKVDRVSMAVSLESRVPFLDRRIVEFAFSLSQEDRCPAGEAKGLLKKAYEPVINREILYRTKQGFAVPADYFRRRMSVQEELLEKLWNI
ncbi:MAG: asparagine synthase (glutamine-hydrolyzing) [Lachnospiraceae bacterium]|nr:asparagine synthase (glutamine-hydrolyzing) [Lachnospiraceae bacterium]